MTSARDLENRFLGALLGLAIGDALGMPVADMPVSESGERFGEIRDYLIRDEGLDSQIPAGEVTDETETVLCIVESMTTNNGFVDPENINARLYYLAEGPSQHWMPESMKKGILEATRLEGLVPESAGAMYELPVAVRGVPIGLMHSVGGFAPELLADEARQVARLSHGDRGNQQLVVDVAIAVADVVRDEPIPPIDIDGGGDRSAPARALVAEMADQVRKEVPFEDIVFGAVNQHRPADSAGAIAGAMAGAAYGASAIPQRLIDGLENRVYLSLAAPWFYRTATRRAGTVIDLRQV